MTQKSTTAGNAQGAKNANNGKTTNEKSNLGVAPSGEIKPTATEEKPQPPKLEAPKPPTVEEIVKKVEILNQKIAVRDQVTRHINNVEKLKFGEFQEKDCLVLQSGAGESYTIKSPKLLKQVQAIMLESLQAEKQLIEAEINF
jgi:hypothetical protein